MVLELDSRSRPASGGDKSTFTADSVTRSEPGRPCWSEIITSTLGTSRVEAVRDEGGFFGRLHLSPLGYVRIAHVELRGAPVRGMRRRARGGRQAFSWLAVSVRGDFEIVYNGRSAVIEPGRMAILDARRTYVTTFAAECEVLWVRLPQAWVESQFSASTQILIDCAQGAGRVLLNAIDTVAAQAAHLDPAQGRRVANGLLAMTAAAGMGRDADTATLRTPSAALRRVKAFILANLTDETLSADSVAAANGLTVRYINKLFEREGASLMRWVWQQRLEAARAALAQRTLDSHSIGTVAYAYGFKSASHFSHAFRRYFGYPPRAEKRFNMPTEEA